MRSNESSLNPCIPALPIVLNEIRSLFGLIQPFRIAHNVFPNTVPLRVLWTARATDRGLHTLCKRAGNTCMTYQCVCSYAGVGVCARTDVYIYIFIYLNMEYIKCFICIIHTTSYTDMYNMNKENVCAYVQRIGIQLHVVTYGPFL